MTTTISNTAPAIIPPRRSLARRVVSVWGLPIVLGTLIAGGWLGYSHFLTPMNHATEIKPAAIDGDRAYGYLKTICELGPHIAGTAANTRARKLVADHFKAHGATLREQPFTARDPRTSKRVEMVNLVASWNPERMERVVIGAHYDTRPFADQEQDPERKKMPFIGANDPASGMAMLMEIAHHLKKLETPWGVDLVLFDGEELVYDRAGVYFLGSREFGRLYKASRKSKGKPRYVAGIVLDLIGGQDLHIPKEGMSVKLANGLVREIWSVAEQINAPAFVDNLGQEVLDDHLPLNDASIPTADIIDFSYPYWHKIEDTPDKCSGASLEQVGRVVTGWLSLPKTRFRGQ